MFGRGRREVETVDRHRGLRVQWFCCSSSRFGITLRFFLGDAIDAGNEGIIAANDVLAEDIEVGAVGKRQQRNRGNANRDR